MDRGGWQATVHGVSKSLTQQNDKQCEHKEEEEKKNYPN